jgi:hypothetical protein
MTGVAWGDYQDYFLGKWDGVTDHLREGQREKNGADISHLMLFQPKALSDT